MINKIIDFIKNLFSGDNLKKNRTGVEKIQSVLEVVSEKEEKEVEVVTKKPRKQTTKKTTSKKKKEG